MSGASLKDPSPEKKFHRKKTMRRTHPTCRPKRRSLGLMQAVRGFVIEIAAVLALLFLWLTIQNSAGNGWTTAHDAGTLEANGKNAADFSFFTDWQPGRDPRRFLAGKEGSTPESGLESSLPNAWMRVRN
jgi:hypothetical protein